VDSAVTGGDVRARTWSAPCQPKNFLRPCLLLLLDEQPDYGYELRDRLSHFSGAHWDAGTIYRVLNAMEDEGLVASRWEPSPSGPQRRRYEMTADGRAVLTHWARGLEEVRGLLIGFLERYERDRQAHLRGTPVNGAANGSSNGAAVPVPAVAEECPIPLPAL
jgi:PadR family transcriptional regulator PadR